MSQETLRDALRFFRYNLQHYALALWGLRLRFDPPYPIVLKFFPAYLAEPVFEYRTYGAIALFAGILAAWLPLEVLAALIVFYAAIAFDRSRYLQSNLVFWRRVLKENGTGSHRAHGRYMEQLIREIERKMKAGEPWEELALEATRLQDEVIARHGSKDGARNVLAGA